VSAPYRARRDRLAASIGEGVVLVRGAGSEGKVSSNFFYLTGLAEPRGVLLLFPEGAWVRQARMPGSDYLKGRHVTSAMFLPPSDPLKRRWGEDGVATLDSETAKGLGVDSLLAAADLPAVLTAVLERTPALSIVRGAPPDLERGSVDDTFVAQVQDRLFGVSLRDATSAATALRMTKSDDEIAAIARAADITAEAFAAARAAARPGMAEHEVEAELARVYRSHGATHAFGPIVASGGRANVLHYRDNDARILDGQLLLVDSGASLDGYGADVKRTWRPGGEPSPRQREVLDAVQAAQAAAIDVCRPGRTLDDVHRVAHAALTDAGFGHAFPHGTSHHLGLETHDPADVHVPLAPNMVITVEPGVYLDDEEIGVRIEDDVRIRDGEPEILTRAIPK